MPSLHPAWRIIGFLPALVFLESAAGGVVRGRFEDPETGLLERARNPVAPALPWLAGPER
jgi:hypothetical protein